MNVNPYNITIPHYDSYDDFYKFFEVEVHPKESKEVIFPEVFPPIEPQIKEKEGSSIQTNK